MNFNLQNLFDALRTIVPETRLNDPGFRNSVIRLAMLEVSMTRPEWFTAIGKLTPVERQSLAAGNDDLQRAFDELAAIDRIPNLKKELSEDDKRRLHDQFDLV